MTRFKLQTYISILNTTEYQVIDEVTGVVARGWDEVMNLINSVAEHNAWRLSLATNECNKLKEENESYHGRLNECNAAKMIAETELDKLKPKSLARGVTEELFTGKQVMIKLPGAQRSFRCEVQTCGCNVFTEISPKKYKCNSCGEQYLGE